MAPAAHIDGGLAEVAAAVGYDKGFAGFESMLNAWSAKSQGILSSGVDVSHGVEVLEMEFPELPADMSAAPEPSLTPLPNEVQQKMDVLQAASAAETGGYSLRATDCRTLIGMEKKFLPIN